VQAAVATTPVSFHRGAASGMKLNKNAMMTYTVISWTPLYQFDRPSPETIEPIKTARTASPSSALPKQAQAVAAPPVTHQHQSRGNKQRDLDTTAEGDPTERSTLFFRAIAIADPLSAAPPTIARNTMPMKVCDIPSRAYQFPQPPPTRISLIHAAKTEATTRPADRSGIPHCSPSL